MAPDTSDASGRPIWKGRLRAPFLLEGGPCTHPVSVGASVLGHMLALEGFGSRRRGGKGRIGGEMMTRALAFWRRLRT